MNMLERHEDEKLKTYISDVLLISGTSGLQEVEQSAAVPPTGDSEFFTKP